MGFIPILADGHAELLNNAIPACQVIKAGSILQELQGRLYVLEESRYDDKSFPSTLVKQGANTKPDFDYTNIGLLFPQNDTSEKIYHADQMFHKKVLGSPIYMHYHFIQASSALPTFKLDYRFYNNGSDEPAGWTTLSSADYLKSIFVWSGNRMLQIGAFAPIDPPANETVSANIDFRFYRDDNAVTGDVLIKFVDYHYLSDGRGSRQPWAK